MNQLIHHAINHVWCEPIQDHQFIFKPVRVSMQYGSRNVVAINRHRIALPYIAERTVQPKFHLYQIGAIDRKSIGLDVMQPDLWYSVPRLMEDNDNLVSVYLSNGAIVPLNLCYLKVLRDGALVLAVELSKTLYGYKTGNGDPDFVQNTYMWKLESGDLFIRFYQNSYIKTNEFLQPQNSPVLTPIRYLSKFIATVNDWFVFDSNLQQLKNEFGSDKPFLFFVDGYLTKPNPGWQPNLFLGRTIGVLFDGTVDRIEYHRLQDLPSFSSELDTGKSKRLLLSYADDAQYIEFVDDVDFYLVNGNPDEYHQGVVIGRYERYSGRQVTHNAWAINNDHIEALINSHHLLADRYERLNVVAVIRKASLPRGLPHQYNEVNELYKLDRQDRIGAMVGVNATLPEWRAAKLENSDYCKLMRASFSELQLPLIADALGYHVVTKIMEPVIYPVLDDTGQPKVISDLYKQIGPSGLANRMVYTYGSDRRLIGYYHSNAQTLFELMGGIHSTAVIMELFHATTSPTTDGTVYGTDVTDPEANYWGYRVYVCPLVAGVPNGQWQDVTGNNTYYQDDGSGAITWNWALLNNFGLYPAYRRNGHILAYDPVMPVSNAAYNGKLEFIIQSDNTWNNLPSTPSALVTVPHGTVDVFMDGMRLIEELDYTLKWPRIVICKRPLGSVDNTVVSIRSYGTCDPANCQPYPKETYGFVKGGALSVDGEYNIRDSRSVMVNVGGRITLPSEVSFAEDEILIAQTDGLPYETVSYITPVEPYIDKDTTAYLASAKAIDTKVMGYLSGRVDTYVPELPVAYWDRYRVFSPFLNYVIHGMLQHGLFPDSQLQNRYGNIEVDLWINSFRYLLDYDPATKLRYDFDYVVIYPHQFIAPVAVSLLQYQFLSYLVRNYLNERVQLAQSVNIGV